MHSFASNDFICLMTSERNTLLSAQLRKRFPLIFSLTQTFNHALNLLEQSANRKGFKMRKCGRKVLINLNVFVDCFCCHSSLFASQKTLLLLFNYYDVYNVNICQWAALILHHQRATASPARMCLLFVWKTTAIIYGKLATRQLFLLFSSLLLAAKLHFNCAIFNDDRPGQVLNEDAAWYYWWHNQLTSYPAGQRTRHEQI